MPPYETTNIGSIGLFFTIVMSMLIFALPRRMAFVPVLVSVCYMTVGQKLVVASLNFTVLRLILLAGIMRILFRGEFREMKLNSLDKLLIVWVGLSSTAYVLKRMNTDAVINQLAFAYVVFGVFFLFRCLVRDLSDMRRAVRILVILAVPLVISMIIERLTRFNIFGIFGGVEFFSMIRDEKIRCQGPFRHPILAGTFGATLVPMALSMWNYGRHGKLFALLGTTAGTIIMVISGSSGPLLSFCFGVSAVFLWKYRNHTRVFFWGSLLAAVFLHLGMKAPLWHLIARVSELVGGTGWHRSFLIDQTIRYFNEWWLIGTNYTAHWGVGGSLTVLPNYPDMIDVTSQYVYVAISGGLISIVLFLIIIGLGFRTVGRIIKLTELLSENDRFTVWSFGATLLVHATSFLSVSYFDQLIVLWYMLLAFLSTLRGHFLQKRVVVHG